MKMSLLLSRNLLFPLVFLCAVPFAVAGCGGSEEESGPAVVDQKTLRREAEERRRQQAAEPREKKQKKESKPAPQQATMRASKPKPAESTVSPVDRFNIVAAPSFAASLVRNDNELVQRDSFVIVSTPAEGIDSSNVLLTPSSEKKPETKKGDFKLPEGFEEIETAGYTETGWPQRIRCLADNSEMVYQAGGPARLGSDTGPPETQPMLKVVVPPFYIDVTEVTLEQYNTFREKRREEGVRIKEAPNDGDDPRYPVLGLPYTQARVYCIWAGKTLPSEVQWEFAARGNDGAQYPWREGHPIRVRDHEETIFPVGTDRFDQTPEGVMDLGGNALEWCNDWYYAETFAQAADRLEQPLRDFTGPGRSPEDNARVVKGGNDFSGWNRRGVPQLDNNQKIGFRGVLSLTPNE